MVLSKCLCLTQKIIHFHPCLLTAVPGSLQARDVCVCVLLLTDVSLYPQVHRGRDQTESEHIQTNADGQRGSNHQRGITDTTSVSYSTSGLIWFFFAYENI